MWDEISGGRNQVKIYAIGSKKVKQSRKYPMFSPGHCPGLAEAIKATAKQPGFVILRRGKKMKNKANSPAFPAPATAFAVTSGWKSKILSSKY